MNEVDAAAAVDQSRRRALVPLRCHRWRRRRRGIVLHLPRTRSQIRRCVQLGKDALKQAAVLICCDVLAQDIAKAPLLQLVDRDTDQVVKPTEHLVARLSALDPNKRHTWFEFHEMAIYWYAPTTNCFICPQRMRTGEATGLILFQTSRVRPRTTGDQPSTTCRRDAAGAPALGVTSPDVVEEDMIHVRGACRTVPTVTSDALRRLQYARCGRLIEQYIEDPFPRVDRSAGVFARDAEGASLPRGLRPTGRSSSVIAW